VNQINLVNDEIWAVKRGALYRVSPSVSLDTLKKELNTQQVVNYGTIVNYTRFTVKLEGIAEIKPSWMPLKRRLHDTIVENVNNIPITTERYSFEVPTPDPDAIYIVTRDVYLRTRNTGQLAIVDRGRLARIYPMYTERELALLKQLATALSDQADAAGIDPMVYACRQSGVPF
jgi:hypothetical protein